jgi:hypothetical protein
MRATTASYFDGGVDVSATSGTLNIGTLNAATINIGGPSGVTSVINVGGTGDTVNIAGTLTYINTTNTTITDKLVTLNKGGAASSAGDTGLELEENNTITGYAKADSARTSWALKAPGSTGVVTITPGSTGFTINQASHNALTVNSGSANGLSVDGSQVLSMAAASASTAGTLSSTDYAKFSNTAGAWTVANTSNVGFSLSGGVAVGAAAPATGYKLDVVGGDMRVGGHILPASNVTYDLGSSNARFRDIYLSGNTINLGGTKLSADSSNNIRIADSSNTLKRLIVSELQIGEDNSSGGNGNGNGKIYRLANVNGNISFLSVDSNNATSVVSTTSSSNNGGSSQWNTVDSSNLSYSLGSVGIGKNPSVGYALDVAGTINATSVLVNGQALTATGGGSGINTTINLSGGSGTGSVLTVDPNSIMNMNQLYKVMSSDAAASDYFSMNAVAVTSAGDVMAVGASQKESAAGKVYLYNRDTSNASSGWVAVSNSAFASGTGSETVGAAAEELGSSVAIASDGVAAGSRVVLVGASGSQKAYLYVYTTVAVSGMTVDKWNRVALVAYAEGGSYGTSCSLAYVAADSGYYAVIGDASGAKVCSYFIPISTYVPVTLGSAYAGADGSALGSSVAISADSKYIVAGAPYGVNGSAVATGAAVVLVRGETGGSGATYTLSTTLYPNDGLTGVHFGSSVAIDGTGANFAVGAPMSSTTSGSQSGAIYMYDRANSYSQVKLLAADTISGDKLGSCVTMDDTGAFVVAGSTPEPNNGMAGAGAAYMFSYSNSAWAYTSKLRPLDPAFNAGFGQAVAVTSGGAFVAVGSYANTHSVSNGGAVYWFAGQSFPLQYNSLTNTALVGGAATSNVNLATGGVPRLTVSGAYVGINKQTPGFALDVAGDLNFTGTLRSNGVAYVGSQWLTGANNVISYGSNVTILGTLNVGAINNISGVTFGNQATLTVNMEPDYYELMQGASNLEFTAGSTYTSSTFTTTSVGSAFVSYAGTGFTTSGAGKITATISLMSSGVEVIGSTKVTSVFSSGGQVSFPALEYKVSNVAIDAYTVQIVFSSNMSCDSNSVHNLAVKLLKNAPAGSITASGLLDKLVSTSNVVELNVASDYAELLQNSSDLVFTNGYTYTSAPFTTASGGSAMVSYAGTGFSTSAAAKISATVSVMSDGVEVDGSTKVTSAYNFGSHASLPALDYKVALPAGTYTVQIVFSANMSSDANDCHNLRVNIVKDSLSAVIPAFVQSFSNFTFSNESTSVGGPLSVTGDLNFNGILRSNGVAYVGSQWSTSNSYVTYANNAALGGSLSASNIFISGNIYQNGSLFAASTTSSVAGSATLVSAANTISLNNLNLNADGGAYKIIFKARNPSATTFNYLMYINDDVVPTNYYTEVMQASGYSEIYTAALSPAGASATHFYTIDLVAGATDGYHQASISGGYSTGSNLDSASVQTYKNFMIHKGTGNITSLTFTSDIASGNGYDTGASVYVYKTNAVANVISGSGSIILGEKAMTKTDVQAAAASASWTPITWSSTTMDSLAYGASSVSYTAVNQSSYLMFKTSLTVGGDNGAYVQFLLQYSTDNATWVDYLDGPGTVAQGQVTFGQSIVVSGGTYGLMPVLWESKRAIAHTAGQTMYFRLQYRMPSGSGSAYINQQAYSGSNAQSLGYSFFTVQEVGQAGLGQVSAFGMSGSNATILNARVGINTATPSGVLQVMTLAGSNALHVGSNGMVGIGKSNATCALDVVGDLKVSGSFYSPGSVIQMQTNVYSESKVLNVTNSFYPFTDIDSSFGVTITPKFVNSTFLIQGMLHIGGNQSTDSRFTFFRIGRTVNSVTTEIGNGNTSGTSAIGTPCVASSCLGVGPDYSFMIANVNITYVDAPATLLPITYRFRWTPCPQNQVSGSVNKNVTINRTFTHSDASRPNTISTITVTEIAM